MPILTRQGVKRIVEDALRRVADFDDDVEGYNFRRFGTFHKEVFLAALKSGVVGTVRDATSHYDVNLNADSFADWPTVGDCITWVFDESFPRKRQTRRLTSDDLES